MVFDMRKYLLVYEGHEYPSKAFWGVAHKYQFPHLGPLSYTEFSGGENAVRKRLDKIGFRVKVIQEPLPGFHTGILTVQKMFDNLDRILFIYVTFL